MKNLIAVVLIAASVVGCAYPTTMVNTVDDRPRITIEGAPAKAQLYVDNLLMGEVGTFSGRRNKALALEAGTHQIEVVSEGRTIHSQRVFLGEGTYKAIHVSGAGK